MSQQLRRLTFPFRRSPARAGLKDYARLLREGRSAQREHVTQLAAYDLAFVAISVLMPGRRVLLMQQGVAPDLLFDTTPGALRGVEVAGRATGGRAALATVRNGMPSKRGTPDDHAKAPSFWRGSTSPRSTFPSGAARRASAPRVSIMEQLK